MSKYYCVGLVSQTQVVSQTQSRYKTGIGGFEIWRGIKTPGQIRDEINRIDSEVKATSSDLMKALEDGGAFPEDLSTRPESILPLVNFYSIAWTPFIQSWQSFAANHQDWTSNIWGDTWDQAVTYQKQLSSLRDKIRALGIKLISPDPVVPKDGLAGLMEILKLALIIGLSLTGLSFLLRFIGH